MEVHTGSGMNYFAFKIDLNEVEAKEINNLMANCPRPPRN
jgi:hypothetical protein